MLKTLALAVFAAVLAVSLGGMMAGGWNDLEVNDSSANKALRFAVNSRNRKTNDLFLHDVQNIVSIKSQVVAGMKYVITANMAKTVCRKSNPQESCPIHQDQEMAMPYQCKFTIWSKPWQNFYQVLEEKC